MRTIIFFLLLAGLWSACDPTDKSEPDWTVMGLKPIYGQVEQIRNVKVEDTIAMLKPGRIVYLAPRLFVNEVNKGIHVIDNSKPSNPVKEAFISIPFNKDLAVQNNIIYADNDRDLITLRYHHKDSIELIERQENVFDHLPAFPNDFNGYFECIDESKGIVVDWEEAELVNPKCRTF
jgi:hypothetical protein